MNLTLIAGLVLFVCGACAAILTMLSTGGVAPTDTEAPAPGVNFLWPIAAGLLLSVGALVMGVSLGNWRHPRTHLEPGHEVVNPEGYHTMTHV